MSDNVNAAREREPSPSSMLAAALELANRGWCVLPCVPGSKKARNFWGKGEEPSAFDPNALKAMSREQRQGYLRSFRSSSDPRLVQAWWSEWPNDNIAVDTGASGLTVIDIDDKNGKRGSLSLDWLSMMHDRLPETLIQRTPSGGRHFVFRGAAPTSSDQIEEGIDVRGRGGYILVAPSRTPTGEYSWSNDSRIVELPDWLERLANRGEFQGTSEPAPPGSVSPEYLSMLLSVLEPENYREHDRWFALMAACHHATSGQGREEFAIWSTSDPNYSEAGEVIRSRWDSLAIARCGTAITAATLFDEVLRAHGSIPPVPPEEDFEPWEEAEPAQSPKRNGGRFRFLTPAELKALPDPRYLVRDVIGQNELCLVYGPPKAGKTHLVLDLSLSVATGHGFHEQPIDLSGPVVYVIGEGNAKLFRHRMEAWRKARGIPELPDSFLVVSDRPTVPVDVAELISSMPVQPVLIVLDTLSRTMAGDENVPRDMAAYVRGCDELREKTGAAVLVVHHEGKDPGRGPMGHTKLRGAIDTSIAVRRDEKSHRVRAEIKDQRNGPGELCWHFNIRVIDGAPCLEKAMGPAEGDFDAVEQEGEGLLIRRLAKELNGQGKKALIQAVAERLCISAATARKRIESYVPKGSADRVQFEGGWLWLEPHPRNSRGSVTVRFETQSA